MPKYIATNRATASSVAKGAQRTTWISWHWHQRSASIVRSWGIEWEMLETDRRGLIRYAELLTRSLVVFWRLRRSTVIVQSPSVVLAAAAVMLAPLLRLRVVVDAHNEAIQPFTQDSPAMRWLVGWTTRRAHLVIVTNEELAEIVMALGGQACVLPDAIPKAPEVVQPAPHSRMPGALIVCTYALDEPLAVFVETARRLQDSVEFRLTGQPNRRALRLLATATSNLKVLGFLSQADYWKELLQADVVVDLTLKPHCLVCGAYEAIGAGKSPILSEDVSNRRLFGDIATFVENTPDALARAVVNALSSPRSASVKAFQERYMMDWQKRLASLKAALDVSA